jgi:hypothetical protein
LVWIKILVHSAKIKVKLVDRGFFKQGCFAGYDLSHPSGIFSVCLPAPSDHDRMRTQPRRRLHGHGRMNSIFPGFIAARGHHAPFPVTSNEQRLPLKSRVILTLHRNKEGIEVKMRDHSLQLFRWCKLGPNILKNLVLIAGNPSEKFYF